MQSSSSTFNCLIIDDDPMICDLIKHFTSKIPEISYCIAALNGKDALQLIAAQEFNLIFLDYNLPDMKGESILELNSSGCPVIMVTSHEDFAAKSYQYDTVIDFLVKPLNFERFEKAVQRFIKRNANWFPDDSAGKNNYFFIKDGHKVVKVFFHDIQYIKAEENYVAVAMGEKVVLTLITMKEIETKLPTHIIRVHRSYFVNMDKIESISSDEILLHSKKIPIGQKYKVAVTDYIKNS